MQSRNSSNLRGIDVSHHNGNIDFYKIKASGIEVVYIKATEKDNYVDPMLKNNYTNAKTNNLKVGFYHFFRTTVDAKTQAHFFVNSIKDFQNDCKHVLDFEVTTINKTDSSNYAKIFMDEVKLLTGDECILYTYTSFAKEYLTNLLNPYSLWIAHYGVNSPGNNGIWDSWIGFQYSENGNVLGISGNVDMNEFTEAIFVNSVNNTSPSLENTSNNISTINQIQSTLNNRYGLNISVDNIYGSETLKAIIKGIQLELNRQFNRDLVVDGIFGLATKTAFITLKKGTSGNLTFLLQALLICKGYSLTPFGADGQFGDLTEGKVKNFQKANCLYVDGLVGKDTWTKLLS